VTVASGTTGPLGAKVADAGAPGGGPAGPAAQAGSPAAPAGLSAPTGQAHAEAVAGADLSGTGVNLGVTLWSILALGSADTVAEPLGNSSTVANAPRLDPGSSSPARVTSSDSGDWGFTVPDRNAASEDGTADVLAADSGTGWDGLVPACWRRSRPAPGSRGSRVPWRSEPSIRCRCWPAGR
jgi:hypothetical protein